MAHSHTPKLLHVLVLSTYNKQNHSDSINGDVTLKCSSFDLHVLKVLTETYSIV